MSEFELDPIDEHFQPLIAAIGRVVLGVAALEKVLLVDIARRRAQSEGLSEQLGAQLAQLETQPAGALLKTLREIGISGETGDRIEDVIRRRNWLVHRFMEDPGVMLAFASQDGTDVLVGRVDHIAADCQSVINELGGPAFAGAEHALGATVVQLLAALRSANLKEIEDEGLRAQLEAISSIDPDDLAAVFRRPE